MKNRKKARIIKKSQSNKEKTIKDITTVKKQNTEIHISKNSNLIDIKSELYWDDAVDETEALYNHMVSIAFKTDFPNRDLAREEAWHNKVMLKYFDANKFKNDLINDGWLIIESKKGFAFMQIDV